MKPSGWMLVTAGIGWMVFYTGSFTALGSGFPTAESTGQEIIDWFTDNETAARTYAWTAAFAALTLTVFGAQIASLLPKPSRYIFFGGIMAWVITGMIQAWFWAGLALHPESLDPASARVIFDIPAYWGPIINGATMAFGSAFVILGFGERRMIPRWLAWLSVLLVVEQGIETVTVFGQEGFFAPGGPMNVYVGGLIGFAWVIGILVWGYREIASRSGAAGDQVAVAGG